MLATTSPTSPLFMAVLALVAAQSVIPTDPVGMQKTISCLHDRERARPLSADCKTILAPLDAAIAASTKKAKNR